MLPTSIRILGEELHILPQKALYWPREKTLFASDLHLGKTDTLRAAGIAVPGDSTDADLTRLARLIERTRATRLIVLGDMFHARSGRKSPSMLDAVDGWRAEHADLDILLVRGNHDRHAGDPPVKWEVRCVDEPYRLGPFLCCHFPNAIQDNYTLAGHIHPSIAIHGLGRQRVRLPCFWFGSMLGVLPAFGGFTGTAAIAPSPGDRIFAIAEDEVIEVG